MSGEDLKDGGMGKDRKKFPFGVNKPNTGKRFEGRCEELKGYIYDCTGAQQADMFIKTSQQIAEYAGKSFKDYPGDMLTVVKKLVKPVFTLPTDPSATASESERELWKIEINAYHKRQVALAENIRRLFSLVIGQCTEVMRAKLKGLDTFEDIDTRADGLDLLMAIKGIVYQFNSQKYLCHAVHEAFRRLYVLQQGKFMTAATYQEQFMNMVDAINATGGYLGVHESTVKEVALTENKDLLTVTNAEKRALTTKAKEKYLATAFLLGADRARYGRYIEDLENDFLQGQDNYPKTVSSSYNVLANWKQDPRNAMRLVGHVNDGVSFVNSEENVDAPIDVSLVNQDEAESVHKNTGTGKKGRNILSIKCFKCNKKVITQTSALALILMHR